MFVLLYKVRKGSMNGTLEFFCPVDYSTPNVFHLGLAMDYQEMESAVVSYVRPLPQNVSSLCSDN